MAKIMLGAHSVKSHGWKVAREHLYDWLILVVLGLIDIVLNVIEPFHRYIGPDMLTDLTFPFYEDTIPMWAVPVSKLLSQDTYTFIVPSTTRNHCDYVWCVCTDYLYIGSYMHLHSVLLLSKRCL